MQVLAHLRQYRFLRSDHLTALVQPGGAGRIGLLKRLGRLFHAGFVDRPKVQLDYRRFGGNPAMVYALSDRGAAALQAARGMPQGSTRWRKNNRRAKRHYLAHTLAIADVLVALEVEARAAGMPVDIRFGDAWTVDASGYGFEAHTGVRPDAVVLLGRPSPALFFLEVDRATMPVTARDPSRSSITKKLCAYHESWKQRLHEARYGAAGVRVLFVTTSAERRDHFREAARTVIRQQPRPRRNGRHLLFTCSYDMIGQTILSTVWYTHRDNTQVNIDIT